MNCKIVDNKIVIEMSVDTLVYACENNPEGPLRVIDENKFSEYIANNILEFDEDESGNTLFQRLLDELFFEALQDGVGVIDESECNE